MNSKINSIRKLQQEEESLWHLAVSRYLKKTDFDITEWLDPKEQGEYIKIRRALGEVRKTLEGGGEQDER